jgi:predicted Rossmann-fold nucleotide-binding protein
MEGISRGVKEAGGTCCGITVRTFDPKSANSFLCEERKQGDMFDRLRGLIDGADLFIAQNGSLGTIAEVSLVWCLRYVNILSTQRICLIGDCWREFIGGIKSMAVQPSEFQHVELFSTVSEFVSGSQIGLN